MEISLENLNLAKKRRRERKNRTWNLSAFTLPLTKPKWINISHTNTVCEIQRGGFIREKEEMTYRAWQRENAPRIWDNSKHKHTEISQSVIVSEKAKPKRVILPHPSPPFWGKSCKVQSKHHSV